MPKDDAGNKIMSATIAIGGGQIVWPWIGFGTGVIWKYSRNPRLFLRVNKHEVKWSIKHRRMQRELYGNLHIHGILRDAYAAGFRLFDTGRLYGYSERAIGRLGRAHSDVHVSTKCSSMDVERGVRGHSVKENLDFSLKELKAEKVDSLLLHWPEGEHWLEYYAEIVEQYRMGRCRVFGACNLEVEHFKRIEDAGLPLPMVMQTELHPLNWRGDVRDYCRDHGIQLMAHTPTARLCPEIRESKVLQELAAKHGKTIAQVILRWHYQNHVIPVVSCFNRKHMEENLDIFDFELSTEDMEAMRGLDCGKEFFMKKGIDDPKYIWNR